VETPDDVESGARAIGRAVLLVGFTLQPRVDGDLFVLVEARLVVVRVVRCDCSGLRGEAAGGQEGRKTPGTRRRRSTVGNRRCGHRRRQTCSCLRPEQQGRRLPAPSFAAPSPYPQDHGDRVLLSEKKWKHRGGSRLSFFFELARSSRCAWKKMKGKKKKKKLNLLQFSVIYSAPKHDSTSQACASSDSEQRRSKETLAAR